MDTTITEVLVIGGVGGLVGAAATTAYWVRRLAEGVNRLFDLLDVLGRDRLDTEAVEAEFRP